MSGAGSAELQIGSIAAGGDGVGRVESLVVFVPRTAPGDVVRVGLQRGRHFARGRVHSLLRPGPERVAPPCAHYSRDRCGGCQLQHLSYRGQLEAKAGIIQDALRRIGRRDVDVPDVRPSAETWRYRRKLTLAFERTSSGWVAGLHRFDDPSSVFQLEDCPITDERVIGIWRQIFAVAAYYPDGNAFRAAVRIVDGVATLSVEGGRRWPTVQQLFAAVQSIAALWWTPSNGPRRLMARRESDTGAGASFAQVNRAVADELRRHVLERIEAFAPRRAVDAYAGTGDMATALTKAGVEVTAIELDRDAARACREQHPAPSRVLAARVEDVIADVLPADVVILNPPRGGVDERVTHALSATSPPPRALIYVSCNPATLARDVARLPRFRVASVVGFDMFPQTAHVETVCELVPEAA